MRIRLAYLIPLVMLFTSVTISSLLFYKEVEDAQHLIEHEGIEDVNITLTHLQNVLNTQLAGDNFQDARLSISSSSLHPGIKTLVLSDEQDNILLASRYTWEGEKTTLVPGYSTLIASRIIQEHASEIITRPDQYLLQGYYPVTLKIGALGVASERVGVLFVEYDLSNKLAQARYDAMIQSLSFGAMLISTAALTALLLHFLISKRVRSMIAVSKKYAAGDFDARVELRGTDELAELGNAFNSMAAQRKQSDAQLRLMATVFQKSGEAFLISDAHNKIVTVNEAFTTMTGYDNSEVIGKNPKILSSGEQSQEFYEEMWQTLLMGGHWHGEIMNRRKDGGFFPAWLTINTVVNDAGETAYYVGALLDITLHKQAEERVRYLAHHDSLTELPNRLLLSDRLTQTIAKAKRHEKPFAVLFLDLDRFKNINDSLGHYIGDLLLKEVARRLVALVRETDTVCRQGGDEFILVLQEIDTPDHAASVAAKIAESLCLPYAIQGHELIISPSIGIALYPQDGSDGEVLIKNADTAMYHAKQSGRNQYQFFTEELNKITRERMDIEHALHKALEKGEFVLHFQPQLNLRTNTIQGVEALIRWQHPELGMVSPGKFIPVAEETGMIMAIGNWVLEEACREGVKLRQAGFPDLKMSVNVSAIQLKQANFAEQVKNALKSSGLEPSSLELEVTESMLMQDISLSIQVLQELSEMGIHLSIDDFGTGYSSLAYLKRLPLNELKIDQSFVRDVLVDRNDASIVEATISLAQSLGLSVVAEGVETKEQLEFLKARGCMAVQGYFIARPMPVQEFARKFGQIPVPG